MKMYSSTVPSGRVKITFAPSGIVTIAICYLSKSLASGQPRAQQLCIFPDSQRLLWLWNGLWLLTSTSGKAKTEHQTPVLELLGLNAFQFSDTAVIYINTTLIQIQHGNLGLWRHVSGGRLESIHLRVSSKVIKSKHLHL